MPGGEVIHSRRALVSCGVRMQASKEVVDAGRSGGQLGAGEAGRGVIWARNVMGTAMGSGWLSGVWNSRGGISGEGEALGGVSGGGMGRA